MAPIYIQILGGGIGSTITVVTSVDSLIPTTATAAQDWAVFTLSGFTNGINISTAQFAELEFATSVSGASLTTGGTGRIKNTTANVTATLSADTVLFDGSTATARISTSDDLMIAAYEMPAPQVVRTARIWAPTTPATLTPHGFAVMKSDDARVTWQPVALFSTPTRWSSSEVRSFSFDPTVWNGGLGRNAARAWRIVAQAWDSGNAPRVGELIFATSAGGATACTSGVPIYNRIGFSMEPNAAFDGTATTFWGGVGIGIAGQRIGYAFDEPKDIREVRIQAATSGQVGTPSSFTVEWSLDFQTWTTALSVAGSSGWSAGEIRAWDIP